MNAVMFNIMAWEIGVLYFDCHTVSRTSVVTAYSVTAAKNFAVKDQQEGSRRNRSAMKKHKKKMRMNHSMYRQGVMKEVTQQDCVYTYSPEANGQNICNTLSRHYLKHVTLR